MLVCVLSLAVGTQTVDLLTVWHAVTDYTDTGNQWIVYELRIPRTVLGIVVGIALGLSGGALIQGITRNPLADSQILGLEGVAGLFVVSAIAFLGFHSLSSYLWFAFLGTFVAMLAVYGVAASGRLTATPVRMLLAGVAIGAVADGISFAIRLRHPRAFDSMRFWDAGALDGRPLEVAATVVPFVIVGAVLCLYVSHGSTPSRSAMSSRWPWAATCPHQSARVAGGDLADRSGDGRGRADRIRGSDGAARRAVVHRAGLALDLCLLRARRAGAAARRRRGRSDRGATGGELPPASSPRSSVPRC